MVQSLTLPHLARVAVCPASPEPRDPLADPANQESPEPQEHQETPENRQLHPASQQLLHHANPAHRDLPDHQDPQELQASPESLALPDGQEPTPHPAHQDLGDLPDQLEKPDHRDLPESPVYPLNQKHLRRASQERLENRDLLAHPDNPDHQEPTVPLDPPDRKESLVQMEFPDQMVRPDLPDLPAQLEPPARKVSARNTAPPTEESFSRMEHVDKLEGCCQWMDVENKDDVGSATMRNFVFFSRLFFIDDLCFCTLAIVSFLSLSFFSLSVSHSPISR